MEENFGTKLRYWRNKLGISQNALAQKSGVSPVTIGHIETKKRNSRRQTLQKLMEGLGLSESQFYSEGPLFPEKPAPITMTEPVKIQKETSKEDTGPQNAPVILSNLDLEIINRTLNLSFEGKITVIRYLKAME